MYLIFTVMSLKKIIIKQQLMKIALNCMQQLMVPSSASYVTQGKEYTGGKRGT